MRSLCKAGRPLRPHRAAGRDAGHTGAHHAAPRPRGGLPGGHGEAEADQPEDHPGGDQRKESAQAVPGRPRPSQAVPGRPRSSQAVPGRPGRFIH